MKFDKNEPDTMRITYLKQLYNSEKGDPESDMRLNALYRDISRVLGDDWSCLLKQYTKRLIEHYKVDVDWFYKMGFNDAVTALSDDDSERSNEQS